MPPVITIRPARPDDLDAILDVAARAWAPVFASVNSVLGHDLALLLHGDDWRRHHAAEVRGMFASETGAQWVAERDSRVVGFAKARIVDPSRRIGQVEIVGVDPSVQRQGIGAGLTRHAESWLRAQGVAVAFIGTAADAGHAPARELYESLDYRAFPVVQYYKALIETE
jgi:ribosomal protein S18 acetylase RimI-like enzyme